MTIQVEVKSNATQLGKALGAVGKKQIPYAIAATLNDLAFDSMREAKSELAESMDLKNKFSQSGIQINKADKKDWPKARAEVGIEERRSYLVDHVTGAKRTGNATHGVAVLQDTTLRSKTGRVPKGKKPGAMLKTGRRMKGGSKPFIIKKSDGQELIAMRTGKQRYPLQILYAFNRSVKIDKEFAMDEIIRSEVAAGYDRAFNKRMKQALATAK